MGWVSILARLVTESAAFNLRLILTSQSCYVLFMYNSVFHFTISWWLELDPLNMVLLWLFTCI